MTKKKTELRYYWCHVRPTKKSTRGAAKPEAPVVPDGGPFASVQACLDDAMRWCRDHEDEEFACYPSEILIGTEVTTAVTPAECASSDVAAGASFGIAVALRDSLQLGYELELVGGTQRRKSLAELSSFLTHWIPSAMSFEHPRIVLAAATRHKLPEGEDEVACELRRWLLACPIGVGEPLSDNARSVLQEGLKEIL